jgi:biotin carboxyl carrier protein
VEEGDEVSVGDPIGLIEARKNSDEAKVEEDGKISKCLVENEEAMEAGQDSWSWS